jgi:hypothetical protein
MIGWLRRLQLKYCNWNIKIIFAAGTFQIMPLSWGF